MSLASVRELKVLSLDQGHGLHPGRELRAEACCCRNCGVFSGSEQAGTCVPVAFKVGELSSQKYCSISQRAGS